jgi:hypothetical protein
MNERIKELSMKYAHKMGNSVLYNAEFLEEFAELIIKECIGQGDTLANHYINTHPEQEQVMLLASIADYSKEIKKHFGVEE